MSETDPEEVYRALRRQALTTPAADVGAAGFSAGTPYGVVMEVGYPTGVATLVGFVDGSASLYFSSGGGVVGGGAHEQARAAAKRLVEEAGAPLAQMEPTQMLPQPPPGMVRFYVLTRSGLLTDQAADSTLRAGEHSLSTLYFSGHNVITELRRLSEQKPPDG